jgi:hypothetical protein
VEDAVAVTQEAAVAMQVDGLLALQQAAHGHLLVLGPVPVVVLQRRDRLVEREVEVVIESRCRMRSTRERSWARWPVAEP